jgi:hypothetical protein
MKASNSSWAQRLSGKIPEPLAHEIDTFEIEIGLRKQGKFEERLFAEGKGTTGNRSRKLRIPPARSPKARTPCGMRPACSASRFPRAD